MKGYTTPLGLVGAALIVAGGLAYLLDPETGSVGLINLGLGALLVAVAGAPASKENIERFINQIAGSQELQARIGTGMDGAALAALGAENGYDFSVEELIGLGELSEQELEGVAGGAAYIRFDGVQGGVLRMDKSTPKSRFRGCVPMDN